MAAVVLRGRDSISPLSPHSPHLERVLVGLSPSVTMPLAAWRPWLFSGGQPDQRAPPVPLPPLGAPPSRGYALWREQKGPLRLLRHIDPHMPDLPDVVFWRVLTFMFGTAYDYPWVRPRLRARAAAAAAARS